MRLTKKQYNLILDVLMESMISAEEKDLRLKTITPPGHRSAEIKHRDKCKALRNLYIRQLYFDPTMIKKK